MRARQPSPRALQPGPGAGVPEDSAGPYPPPVPGPPAPVGPLPSVPQRRPGASFEPSDLVGRVPHGEPLARRMVRTVGRGLGTTRGARELERLAAAAQRPVTTGRRIAVTSVRGGAGKSAVSALLGTVFAARRGDPVLAVDADPDTGSLAWRLGLPTGVTMAGLAPMLLAAQSEDLRSLAGLLPRTPAGLWVLPGGSGGDTELVRVITRALSRLFAVCVTDSWLGIDSLADAHAVVVVTPANPDGVRSTQAVLDRVAQVNPASLARVVVALNTLHPVGRSALRRGSAAAAFAVHRVPVVTIPHDRHVVSGAPINPGRVAEPTLLEVTRLAALTLRRAAGP